MDQRILEMTEPILITGCARSGTSLVAGVIDICGAFGGKMTGKTKYNQKGQFENTVIRDVWEKGFLRGIGYDPLGQYPLPDTAQMMIPRNWKQSVETILKKDGYKQGPWYYKGAKACLIWPVWNYAFPNAKWVIVRRKDEDIVQSCINTGFMQKCNGIKDTPQEGWQWWVEHHKKRFVEMVEAGLNVKQIWPERMVNGNYEQLKEVIEWLGLQWKHEEAIQFIDPKLWKSRYKANGK